MLGLNTFYIRIYEEEPPRSRGPNLNANINLVEKVCVPINAEAKGAHSLFQQILIIKIFITYANVLHGYAGHSAKIQNHFTILQLNR
jgi:hypothetical protein